MSEKISSASAMASKLLVDEEGQLTYRFYVRSTSSWRLVGLGERCKLISCRWDRNT